MRRKTVVIAALCFLGLVMFSLPLVDWFQRPEPSREEIIQRFAPEIPALGLEFDYSYRAGLGGYLIMAKVSGANLSAFIESRKVSLTSDPSSAFLVMDMLKISLKSAGMPLPEENDLIFFFVQKNKDLIYYIREDEEVLYFKQTGQ